MCFLSGKLLTFWLISKFIFIAKASKTSRVFLRYIQKFDFVHHVVPIRISFDKSISFSLYLIVPVMRYSIYTESLKFIGNIRFSHWPKRKKNPPVFDSITSHYLQKSGALFIWKISSSNNLNLIERVSKCQ